MQRYGISCVCANISNNKVLFLPLFLTQVKYLSGILKLLPLQGDRFADVITQGDALG